jgi:hypothetical protein
MCFSAPASLIAGVTLCAIGKETLKKAKVKSEIPFASIPLIFGIQQIIEGLVWLSVGIPSLNHIAAFAFLIFAYVFWPSFAPVAVLLMEKDPSRKKFLKFFIFIGIIVSVTLFYSIIKGPVSAQIIQNTISYSSANTFPFIMGYLYIAATSLCFLFSTHKMLKVFGVTLFVSSFTAYQCYVTSWISVWCFFAAILSFIVYLHFAPVDDLIREIKTRLKMA